MISSRIIVFTLSGFLDISSVPKLVKKLPVVVNKGPYGKENSPDYFSFRYFLVPDA